MLLHYLRGVELTTFRDLFFFFLNCPHHVFFSFLTLLSLSVSSPRGECQQEVGLGRDMKQRPAHRLESCLTLHSKNEPAAFISRGAPK